MNAHRAERGGENQRGICGGTCGWSRIREWHASVLCIWLGETQIRPWRRCIVHAVRRSRSISIEPKQYLIIGVQPVASLERRLVIPKQVPRKGSPWPHVIVVTSQVLRDTAVSDRHESYRCCWEDRRCLSWNKGYEGVVCGPNSQIGLESRPQHDGKALIEFDGVLEVCFASRIIDA